MGVPKGPGFDTLTPRSGEREEREEKVRGGGGSPTDHDLTEERVRVSTVHDSVARGTCRPFCLALDVHPEDDIGDQRTRLDSVRRGLWVRWVSRLFESEVLVGTVQCSRGEPVESPVSQGREEPGARTHFRSYSEKGVKT